ncbi:MAG: DUF3006 family protein [Selenomonadaceae bacterium]|nr:DUF3006 family protein [Selenomonadaceae bacterium]
MDRQQEKINLDELRENNLDAENISDESNSNKSNSDEKVFSVYLDRIEELEDGTADAVLLLDDDEDDYSAQIVIPASCLPDDVSDGDYLTIKISYDEAKTKAAFETARQLLNDL